MAIYKDPAKLDLLIRHFLMKSDNRTLFTKVKNYGIKRYPDGIIELDITFHINADELVEGLENG